MRLFGLLVLSTFVALTLCAPQLTQGSAEIGEAEEVADSVGPLLKLGYDNADCKTQFHYTD